MSPDSALRCLLIQPEFCDQNYWNFVAAAELIGAKTPSPPLGLLTIAALLPSQWTLKVVDLNVRPVTELEWDEADLICTGGMLPQQPACLAIIERARASGKYVVVGGPDPSSQPDVYRRADALVLGEGENSIPIWIESWRKGTPNGIFQASDRPDLALSPMPRFDLIRFEDYVYIGVQLSRGCPFNCEFCDIIELYGRRPRSKSNTQFLAELDRLYELGYRGWVNLVDDNFIGNRRLVKPLLTDLAAWCERRRYPFYFTIEATMNLADDEELLRLMQLCEVRHVFMGIETPDPELLNMTQKSMNAFKPINERIQRVYDHGIMVTAGFIIGFDGEKSGSGETLTRCIEDTSIAVAMAGLLVALPNTQLSRRLLKEGRLLTAHGERVIDSGQPYCLATAGSVNAGTDQSAIGINFITTRDRVEIYREYQDLIRALYSPKAYMDRVLDMARRVKTVYRHFPSRWELRRDLRGLAGILWWLMVRPTTLRLFLRNIYLTLRMGLASFDLAVRTMTMYIHLEPMSATIIKRLDGQIDYALHQAEFPRQVSDDFVSGPDCHSETEITKVGRDALARSSNVPLVT